MEARPTVRRFPASASVLILGLVAALAVVMSLSIGGWGLSIPGLSSGSPATETQQPTTVAPDATNPQTGYVPYATGPACTWGLGCSSSP